jgi:hypothetical protein
LESNKKQEKRSSLKGFDIGFWLPLLVYKS